MAKKFSFPIKNCTAIILAGGKSSRMPINKKYLKIENSFLLDRVISNASDLFENIIVSTSEEFSSEHKNIKIVLDTYINRGPLAGILTGLKNSLNDNNFIIAADIPEISKELISELYSFTEKHEIVVPRSGEKKLEPLFGFYKKSIIPYLEENLSKGNNKVLDIYKHSLLKIVDMKRSDWFFNLNTEPDLLSYLSYLGKK